MNVTPFTTEELFSRHVNKTDACWLWTASIDPENGYGRYGLSRTRAVRGRTQWWAHRLAYELWVGPIPEGLEIDHVKARGCTSRACVNPAHLEAVTPRVNVLRSSSVSALAAMKTHCPQGHPYDLLNTYRAPGSPDKRHCRTCLQEHNRTYIRPSRRRVAA